MGETGAGQSLERVKAGSGRYQLENVGGSKNKLPGPGERRRLVSHFDPRSGNKGKADSGGSRRMGREGGRRGKSTRTSGPRVHAEQEKKAAALRQKEAEERAAAEAAALLAARHNGALPGAAGGDSTNDDTSEDDGDRNDEDWH